MSTAPKVTLKANYADGEGSVEFSPEFMAETAMWRADVLRDWLGVMIEAYAKALEDVRVDLLERPRLSGQDNRGDNVVEMNPRWPRGRA